MVCDFKVLLLVLLFNTVLADVFLQNPRGSNNRCTEDRANRKNANRLFDSQNNDKGGYNTGDMKDTLAKDPHGQYSMQHYASGPSDSESSKLMVEWTNQHGCGSNEKVLCNIVIQYMCQNNGTDDDHPGNGDKDTNNMRKGMYMRDGIATEPNAYVKPPTRKDKGSVHLDRFDGILKQKVFENRGLHESLWSYDTCRYRERNGGLFTSTQTFKNDAISSMKYVPSHKTRQNSGGNKNGYECPEERDYFPYWHPTNQHEDVSMFQNTPWIDLAWLGDKSRCQNIKDNSYNRNGKHRCVMGDEARKYGKYITKEDCNSSGGQWVEFTSFLEILDDIDNENDCNTASNKDQKNTIFWGKLRSDKDEKKCIVQAPEIICDEAPYSRVNHLGNAYNGMGDMKTQNVSRIEVDMPHFPSGEAKRCVMRVRYNISTTDYDPWTTDSTSNDVIEDNPELDILGNGEKLQINMNTNQIGRTFQDRSHVYIVLPRLPSMKGKTLYNLNVRGKRGNLEETVPATEYDFIPDRLVVKKDDLVHIQWTGSNSHANKNDGNSGQGQDGTDRHNLLEMESLSKNTPLAIGESKFWENVESLTDPDATSEDIAVGFATSGFYCAKKETGTCPKEFSMEKKRNLNKDLNNAPASYFGHVLKFKGTGSMFYICSRNNNFSNRSQKGALWVEN